MTRQRGFSARRGAVALFYAIVIAGMILSSAPPLTAGGLEGSRSDDLNGPTWQWQRTLMNDDTSITPDEPSRYTLTFHDDGTVAAGVDCNRMGGTYRRAEASITIELTHGTRAMCPPDSLDVEFQRQIGEVRQMIFMGGALHFDLAGHRGTMTFVP